MADVHSKETRSYNMSRIKSRDTKPELAVRSYLHGRGFRYRLHVKELAGKPDIVFSKLRTVIFVHGCFWHGHDGCAGAVVPKTRTDWWLSKINSNKLNDMKSTEKLRAGGWRVLQIWECQLKRDKAERTLTELEEILRSP